jgi:hypothetical protein
VQGTSSAQSLSGFFPMVIMFSARSSSTRNAQNQGVGTQIWQFIEARYPETTAFCEKIDTDECRHRGLSSINAISFFMQTAIRAGA